ncbi:hypothetical protein OXX79_006178 [Metschnikowia pulcherrima]
MAPASGKCYRGSRATVADDCLSAFNESKLGKRSKFETRETIDCRVQAGHWSSCPKTNGKRAKIVFHTWSPDTAPVRSKMVYASSKDALRRAMDGTAADIQGTDFSGVAYDSVLERVGRKAGSY